MHHLSVGMARVAGGSMNAMSNSKGLKISRHGRIVSLRRMDTVVSELCLVFLCVEAGHGGVHIHIQQVVAS
jgi:hypothetical protein